MKGLQKSFERTTYFDFMKIEQLNWKEKVRFFERRYEDINDLDYPDQIEIWYEYAIAIFELENYHQFISITDELIPAVIQNNISEIRGNDVFQSLLLCKAYSHASLDDWTQAKHIFTELLKIDSSNEDYKKAYLSLTLHRALDIPQSLRLLSVVAVIIFLIVSIAELLIFAPFHGQWQVLVTCVKFTALLLSFVPVAIFFGRRYLLGRRDLNKVLDYSRNKWIRHFRRY